MNNDFINGSMVGVCQTIIGYPLDTIKCRIQSKKNIKQLSIKYLFRGISFPFASSVLLNTSLFGMYSKFYNRTNSHFLSGFCAGTINSVFVTPFDYYKINYQINKGHNFDFKPFRGLSYVFLRESISSSLYFGIYFNLNDKINNPLISGGTAGICAWLFTYPIDTVKTRFQGDLRTTYFDAIKQKNYFNGLRYCLFRACIVNSLSFYLYEQLKKY